MYIQYEMYDNFYDDQEYYTTNSPVQIDLYNLNHEIIHPI